MPANNNARSDAGRDDARPGFRVDRRHDRVRPTCLTSWTCGFDQAGFPEPTLGEPSRRPAYWTADDQRSGGAGRTRHAARDDGEVCWLARRRALTNDCLRISEKPGVAKSRARI